LGKNVRKPQVFLTHSVQLLETLLLTYLLFFTLPLYFSVKLNFGQTPV